MIWTYSLWALYTLRLCAQSVCTPNCHVVWSCKGILPLKKRVNRNKCRFATKQRTLRHPGSSSTLLSCLVWMNKKLWRQTDQTTNDHGIHSWYQSLEAVYFFQAGVLFSIENAEFLPILAILSCTFWCAFTCLDSAVVHQISGMMAPVQRGRV